MTAVTFTSSAARCAPIPITRLLLEHARAQRVTVRLTKPGAVVQLVIHDDGIGFDPEHHPTRRKGKSCLGLLSMRERANYSGGTLKINPVRRAGLTKAGTTIEVRVPLGP